MTRECSARPRPWWSRPAQRHAAAGALRTQALSRLRPRIRPGACISPKRRSREGGRQSPLRLRNLCTRLPCTSAV